MNNGEVEKLIRLAQRNPDLLRSALDKGRRGIRRRLLAKVGRLHDELSEDIKSPSHTFLAASIGNQWRDAVEAVVIYQAVLDLNDELIEGTRAALADSRRVLALASKALED